MKHVLVTGANGLIGRCVARNLTARGLSVTGLGAGHEPDGSGFEFVTADIRDAHRIRSAVGDRPFDAIVHCAALSGPMVSRDDPQTIVDVNVNGTTNLLELARTRGIPRFVYCSSITVYGNAAEDGIREEQALNPTNVYAATKVAGEALLRAYQRRHGLHAVALRISSVFGPGRTTACFIRDLLTGARHGTATRLPFGTGFPRQYVYVEDAAAAVCAAVLAVTTPNGVYNVTGGECSTLDEVARRVAAVVPGVDYSLGEGPDPDDDDITGRLDISAASRDLGYTPQWTLKRGVEKYAEYLSGQ